jgi:peptidoglycan/xylan/chitin deacetylase (PgdA/CDA1 family)
MYRFHQTPFEEIINNILETTEKYGASFTFPTVASVAGQKPELLKQILNHHGEIAIHGFQHVKYPLISYERQDEDLRRAIKTFKNLGIPFHGFRAPYNAYGQTTASLIEKHGFLWDGGLGYSKENRTKTKLFRISQDGREMNFLCFPLDELSDDLMIDERNYSNEEMKTALRRRIDDARKVKGLVAFDLHPIRIGQPQFVPVLEDLVSYGTSIGGWFPTVSEAVELNLQRSDWNGHEFCCLLTGDIDNFFFRDYLKRLY